MRALPAIPWQSAALGKAKLLLSLGIGHLAPMGFIYIADLILGIDIVVAGKHISVVLDSHTFAAELRSDATLRRPTQRLSYNSFKEIDVHLTVVALVPIIPDIAKKPPPVIWIYRPVANH